MSTRKPDEVITHRLELGRWERDRIEGLLAAQAFNKVATPVVAGMSDVSFMVVLAGILVIWFPDIVIPSGAPTPAEIVKAIDEGVKSTMEKAKEETEAVLRVEPQAVREERATSFAGGILNVIDMVMATVTGRLQQDWDFKRFTREDDEVNDA